MQKIALTDREHTYNFSAGPAMLPYSVLLEAQASLLNWKELGCSVMEISHRSKEFMELAEETSDLFSRLLSIPKHYKVLFFQGGARGQFSAVVSNILGQAATTQQAQYFISGYWSKLAAKEAARTTEVIETNLQVENNGKGLISQENWDWLPQAGYYHVTNNETIDGIQMPALAAQSKPLVADMTSYLLSEPFAVENYQLIYASAQKNLGISGVTFVIVDPSCLEAVANTMPSIFDYQLQIKQKSLYNTSPTFPVYMTNLMLKWVKQQGGVEAVSDLNEKKAQLLYDYIDGSEFYVNAVSPLYRSKMNVPFLLQDSKLEQLFLDEAYHEGLVGLQGHRSVGGLRASIYNSMPVKGVEKLIEFMKNFVVKHQH